MKTIIYKEHRMNAGETICEKVDIFRARTGGYATYRVPGIVVTTEGTVLAYGEARRSTGGDWGAIDILIRRSVDGGRTWSPPRKLNPAEAEISKNPVALEQDLATAEEHTFNNAVAIVDREKGGVHFLYCAEYARCYYLYSEDDGQTFGQPTDITATFERFRPDYDWHVVATGPGHGIQLQSGRLLVPVWLSTGTGRHGHRPSCVSTIYSDDHGATWERGEIVVSPPELKNPSETVAAQLHDGHVMLNIRHEGEPHRRAISLSPDGSSDWSSVRFDDALFEPVCMGSIARLSERPEYQKNRLLFANPDSGRVGERRNVTVKLSYDEGETWPVSKCLEPGDSGYTDLAVGCDGIIYCVYERGTATESQYDPRYLTVARLNLAWLTDGDDALKVD
jgi:sialidase-1